jgi:hypothetical protein
VGTGAFRPKIWIRELCENVVLSQLRKWQAVLVKQAPSYSLRSDARSELPLRLDYKKAESKALEGILS